MESSVAGNTSDSEYHLELEMEFSLVPPEGFPINELFCAQKSSADHLPSQTAVHRVSQSEVPFQPPPNPSPESAGRTTFRPFRSSKKLNMPPFQRHSTLFGCSHALAKHELASPSKMVNLGSNPRLPVIFSTGMHIGSNVGTNTNNSKSIPPHPSNFNSDLKHHDYITGTGSNIHTIATTSSVTPTKPSDSIRPYLMTQLAGSGKFTLAEAQKITNNPKLSEIACNDPKRAKKLLSNRVSAQKAKERKKQYLMELEKIYQNLQIELAVLPANVKFVKDEVIQISRENEILRIQISILNEQAKAKQALGEALKREVDELKLLQLQQQHMVNANNNMSSNPNFFQLDMQQQQQIFSSVMSMLQCQSVGGCDCQVMSEMSSSNDIGSIREGQ